MIEISKTVY